MSNEVTDWVEVTPELLDYLRSGGIRFEQKQLEDLIYDGQIKLLSVKRSTGEFVGVLGAIHKWQGVWEAFYVYTKGGALLPFYRALKFALTNPWNVDRVQANIKADNRLGIRLVESLGFKREGLMIKFKDQENYYMYARTY